MTTLSHMSLNSTPTSTPAQRSNTSTAFPLTTNKSGMSSMEPMSNGLAAPMGFPSMGLGMGMCPSTPAMYGGMATTTSTPNFSSLIHNQPQPAKPDMSALDSLFVPNKPKVSLNQMTPKPALGTSAPSPWINQFGVSHPSQTTPMHGSAMGMSSVQSGFGVQANPFFNPHNFVQPAVNTSALPTTGSLKHSTSANNDLKDLFG